MTLHPEPENSDTATTSFHLPKPADTACWTRHDDTDLNDRLCIFVRTGGDGSWAGLWLDDTGQQRFVHLGSGSGSVMLSVLTENVDDLLRLLAIGYDELCWPDQFALTPEEVAGEDDDDGDYPPPPRVFRDYVERECGLRIPQRASEIVVSTVIMGAPESDDPFWNWLRLLEDR